MPKSNNKNVENEKKEILRMIRANQDSFTMFLEAAYLRLLRDGKLINPNNERKLISEKSEAEFNRFSQLFCDFSEFELKSLIKEAVFGLFNKDSFHSTRQLNQVVYNLLGLDKPDCNAVLDAFCSEGDFLVSLLSPDIQENRVPSAIYACDPNQTKTFIADLLADIFGTGSTKVKVAYEDCLVALPDIEFNRARIFGPLAVRKQDEISNVNTTLFPDLPSKNIAHSQWSYIDRIFKNDIPDFRAVALVTGNALWDSQTETYRSRFIESGYLEGVIALPQRVVPFTSVSLFLLVLSNGNKQVKFLDAASFVLKEIKGLGGNDMAVNLDVGRLIDGYDLCQTVKPVEQAAALKNLVPSIANAKKKEIKNAIRLGDFADVFAGSQYTLRNFADVLSDEWTGHSILTSNDINDHYINCEALQNIVFRDGKFDKFAVEFGDVIISAKSSKIKIGVVDFQPKGKIIVTGGMIVVRPLKDKLNPFYLKAFFDSELGQQELKTIQKGVVVVSINAKDVSEIAIPYVDMQKQERIACKYQNNVSSLIALREETKKIEKTLAGLFDEEVTE